MLFTLQAVEVNRCRSTMVRVAIFLVCISPIFAGNIVSELMKDSVATFSDATRLMYYSFFPPKSMRGQAQDKQVDLEEAKRFLESQGIQLDTKASPIKRERFAKTLIERFKLEKSMLTSLTSAERLYFQDAIRHGIFSNESRPEETLSTREMLSAYKRASALSKL